MSRKTTKPAPASLDARAKAKLRAALHEAGHFIAAKHFGVAEVSGLHPVGVGQFAGKTVYGSTAAFNESVIGWCGPLAESRPGRHHAFDYPAALPHRVNQAGQLAAMTFNAGGVFV